MKKTVKIYVTVRHETARILERLAGLAAKKKGARVSTGETAGVVLEVGLRALAEEARDKDDPEARELKAALLGPLVSS